MELFLDQSNYIGGGLSPRAGARVVVHPRYQLPLPNENGLTIPPHTATSAALVQVIVHTQVHSNFTSTPSHPIMCRNLMIGTGSSQQREASIRNQLYLRMGENEVRSKSRRSLQIFNGGIN